MGRCVKEQDWVTYYKENMKALGLPVPEGMYAGKQDVINNILLIIGAIEKLGKTVTVAEVIGATTGAEMLLTVGAVSAAGYLGAMVGSAAVATQRYSMCGVTLADVAWELMHRGTQAPNWLQDHIQAHPELIGKKGLAPAATYGYRIQQ